MNSEWQPIETAPKGPAILLFGRIDPENPHDALIWDKPCVFSGYWSQLDDAWCTSGSTWTGPFMCASHWMPLPSPPPLPESAAK